MPETFLEEPELTASERRRLLESAKHRGEFVLADNRFRIGADARSLAGFREHYGALEVAADPTLPVASEIVCVAQRRPGARLTLLVNGRPYRIYGEEAVANAFVTVFHLVTTGIRSHYLVHAGCVAIRGRGIVLAGASGMGKSTLSAHLAVRGADLLSDELAPLDRVRGLIVPAPFLVGIRPGAGEPLIAGRPTTAFTFRDDRKQLVSVRALAGRDPSGPVRPHAVVFVTPRVAASVTTLTKHDGPIKVVFTAWTAAFGAELAAIPGLRLLANGFEDELPFAMIECGDTERAMAALLRLVGEHAFGIVGMRLEGHAGPDFAAEPILARVPAAVGVIELVKKVFPLQMKALLRGEFEGRMAPLVRELAGLLRETAFYKLTPGRLEAMLPLIEGLV